MAHGGASAETMLRAAAVVVAVVAVAVTVTGVASAACWQVRWTPGATRGTRPYAPSLGPRAVVSTPTTAVSVSSADAVVFVNVDHGDGDGGDAYSIYLSFIYFLFIYYKFIYLYMFIDTHDDFNIAIHCICDWLSRHLAIPRSLLHVTMPPTQESAPRCELWLLT